MWVTLDPLTTAVPAVWLPVIEYVGGAATILGIIVGWVARFRAARKKAMAAADKPTQPPAQPAPVQHLPTNPFGHAPPPTDPYLLARIALLEGQADLRQQWVEQDLRRALAEASTDLAQKTRALLRERELRKAAETRLAGKEQQLATLEAAYARVSAELQQAQREVLDARERERRAASLVPAPGEDDKRTPIRPPAPPRRYP